MAKPKPNKGKGLGAMNTIVVKLLMALDDNYVNTLNLNEKNAEVKALINDQLDLAKGKSGGSIIDFTRQNVISNNKKDNIRNNEENDILNFIKNNSGSLYQSYIERNKNKFMEAKDLKFISKFIPALGQCVRIALTHIVSSDDLSGSVKRGIDFGDSIDDDEAKILMDEIEKFEKETKLLSKLKNFVFYNSLVSGNHYVYAVSYKKLFEQYSAAKARAKKLGNSEKITSFSLSSVPASESVTVDKFIDTDTGALTTRCALESAQLSDIEKGLSFDGAILNGSRLTDETKFKKGFMKSIADVYISESQIPEGIMDSMEIAIEAADHDRQEFGNKMRNKIDQVSRYSKSSSTITDGVADMGNAKGEKFDVTGTYLKFIDCRNIIKLEALGEVIGYLYVEAAKKTKSTEGLQFTNGELTNIKREETTEKIAKMLSAQVIKNFSVKYVKDNIQFKNLIASCIMANGVINTEYKIQFIPPEDIFEFPINVDENGNGVSMLRDSLFPAKILCSYTMRKHLNYINKSGDKNLAYFRGGNADLNKRNQAQRIIRNLQEQNITFGDMMSDQSLMFSKFASDNNILIPVGKSGNKLIEFEKMEGQNIDMSTEYEKELKDQAIIATGVPPLLIEQFNQADFSKAYTTAHIGFAGIVASWQSDLEDGATHLYSRIIENLDIPDELKSRVLGHIKFKLPRPKALAAINNTEAISNATTVAQSYTQQKYGDDANDKKNEVIAIQKAIIRDQTPFIDWEHFDAIADETLAELDNVTNKTGGNSETAGASEF